MKGVGLMICTADSHQGAIEMFWPRNCHVILFIYVNGTYNVVYHLHTAATIYSNIYGFNNVLLESVQLLYTLQQHYTK